VLPSWQWSTRLDRCILFGGRSRGHMECQLQKVVLFRNLFPKALCDLSNDVSLQGSQSVISLFDPHLRDGLKLVCLVNERQMAPVIGGHGFSSVTSFARVFEESQGLAFVLTRFARIDLPGDGDRSSLCEALLELVHRILENCDQATMSDLNGFHVIAHFFGLVSPETLTPKVYIVLFGIHVVLRDGRALASFLRDLIFNYELWRKSPVATRLRVFESWVEADGLYRDTVESFLVTAHVIEVVHSLYEER